MVILDNLSTGHLESIRTQLHSKQAHFVNGDIRDHATVMQACQGVRCVFHLAAVANVRWSIQNPDETHQINATGTLNVLRACLEARVPNVIFASSCAVYGSQEKLPIEEKRSLSPSSPYAASKVAAEAYVQAFASSFGLESTILRLFNVYGQRQAQRENSGVIANIARMLFAGTPPVVYGDGEQRRDFIYVEDVVGAFVNVLKAQGRAEGIYNIGTGNGHSVNEVLEVLRRLLGKEEIQANHLTQQPGEVRDSVADIRRAKARFGFKAVYSLEEGLGLTFQEAIDRAQN